MEERSGVLRSQSYVSHRLAGTIDVLEFFFADEQDVENDEENIFTVDDLNDESKIETLCGTSLRDIRMDVSLQSGLSYESLGSWKEVSSYTPITPVLQPCDPEEDNPKYIQSRDTYLLYKSLPISFPDSYQDLQGADDKSSSNQLNERSESGRGGVGAGPSETCPVGMILSARPRRQCQTKSRASRQKKPPPKKVSKSVPTEKMKAHVVELAKNKVKTKRGSMGQVEMCPVGFGVVPVYERYPSLQIQRLNTAKPKNPEN